MVNIQHGAIILDTLVLFRWLMLMFFIVYCCALTT